jgi:hypothetical protein
MDREDGGDEGTGMPTIPIREIEIGEVAFMRSVSEPGTCYGFSIKPRHGTPLISIIYRTTAEATAARRTIERALRKAVEVGKPG